MLLKIETILKHKLKYDSNRKDIYSQEPEDSLYVLLEQTSSQIYRNHKSKLTWASKFFNNEKEIYRIYSRIYCDSPQIFPTLPYEVNELIFEYLGFSELGALAQLNHQGRSHVGGFFSKKAERFGYEGADITQVNQYLGNLFKGMDNFSKHIPEKYLSYNNKKLNSEKTLLNLQTNLTLKDIFTILSNKNLYSPVCQELRKIIYRKVSEKLINSGSRDIKHIGNKALILAAANGDKNIVELMLEHGVRINATDEKDLTALSHAIIQGKTEIVKLLFDQGATVNKADPYGRTAVILAILHEQTEVIKILAETDCICRLAKSKDNLKELEILLQHGANINATDKSGVTPLHYAIRRGQTEVVKFLIDHGADVNIEDKWGSTPLFSSNSVKITKLLLDSGRVNIEHISKNGFPILQSAISNKELTKIRLIIQHGANINAQDKWGFTPLHHAIRSEQPKVIKLLIDHGVNINTKDQWGFTPLQYARQYQKTEVVNFLIDQGADVNTENKLGETPSTSAETTSLLVNAHAIMRHGEEKSNSKGKSPLSFEFLVATNIESSRKLENFIITDIKAKDNCETSTHSTSAETTSILVNERSNLRPRFRFNAHAIMNPGAEENLVIQRRKAPLSTEFGVATTI